MYLIEWIPDGARMEASLGGAISGGEMSVFMNELHREMEALNGRPFDLVLDYSRAVAADEGVEFALARILADAPANGADRVTFIANSDREVERWTSARLQFVLEGREIFVAA